MAILAGLVAGALVLIGFSSPEELSNSFYFFQFYNIFGFFWSMNFMNGICQMTKSRSFASWYWKIDKITDPDETVFNSLRVAVG